MSASYLDKSQVNTAITDNTKLDLGHQHVTTADFMQLNVALCTELVPGSKIDVNMESFARLNPLPVPTFGRASMRNRAFFVPFRTIFRGWNDFITDSVHVASDGLASGPAATLANVPTISNVEILLTFLNNVTTSLDGNGFLVSHVLPTSAADLTVNGSDFDFTVKGRQALKILESLGYKIDPDADATKNYKDFSAMPLLALAKIYCDWYFPQQYSNLSSYDALLSMCNYDVQTGSFMLNALALTTILNMCSYVQYDSDYFVSAWDKPNSPNSGNYSGDFKLVNIDTVGEVLGAVSGAYSPVNSAYVTNNTGSASSSNRVGGADAPFITPYVTAGTSSGGNTAIVSPISEYLLHSLHALTDYMKRHQLAGSRAMDRYLARFGKALSAEKLNRSLYLGSSMQNIQIGDIMSTSDTQITAGNKGAQLGAYAGKGMSYGSGHFSCNTDEFGYFIILSSIVPSVGYFQGIDRQVMRTTKLDFFTPEFDSLGVQPITACELYMPQSTGWMLTGNRYEQVFGFTPRYADYKQATTKNRVTGNFRLRSINGALAGGTEADFNAADSWYLDRVFDAGNFGNDWANVVHSPGFIEGSEDFSQYKRIFYYDDPTAPDNFTVIHNFEIAEYAPMKPLWDSYEFEDKGKKVTLEANGVKLN